MFASREHRVLPRSSPFKPSETSLNPPDMSRGQQECPQTTVQHPRIARSTAFAPHAASQPVSIPSRSKPRRHSANSRTASKTTRATQNPDSVPPSVAALLAVTSIPPRKSPETTTRRRSSNGAFGSPASSARVRETPSTRFRRVSEANSPSSVMDVLLSPPDETEERDTTQMKGAIDDDDGPCTRSISFDSVPSLYTDDESSMSPSAPLTPAAMRGRRASYERRAKYLSSPPSEECASDHPLLPGARIPEPPSKHLEDSDQVSPSPPPERRRTLSRKPSSVLKSNLTASFRVLRSAARSFTNLATSSTTASSNTPFITPEDYLTRSILSITPQFTDERRPLPLPGDPTPALRRYLNPTTSPSPLDHPHGMQQYTPTHHELDGNAPFTASIQLQTYRRAPLRRSSTQSGTSPSGSARSTQRGLSSEFPSEPIPWPTRRENRENSDFLRVIVFEMNMRRAGKLADEAPGKARFVLPPRGPACAAPVTSDKFEDERRHGRGRRESGGSCNEKIGMVEGTEEVRIASVPRRWRSSSPG